MKTKSSLLIRSLFLVLALSPVPFALSQIPQGFNYQAIARDGTGAVLQNTPLQVMLTIQSSSSGGTIFWKELFSTVTTNNFGLFTIVAGTGARQEGVVSFDLIDWGVTPKYLKTEIYTSGPWLDMGTSQLYAVPYAINAKNLTGTAKLGITGTTANLNEPLFEVRNKDGQTVFAVYNEGVRVYVSNGSKGLKGGFAVGGFGTDTKAESTKYLFVDKDSVRIYLDSNPATKGLKGSFAVGGYDLTKGPESIQRYLDVSTDSVRIYIDSNPSTKKLKGGFAVGGYDMTKGTNIQFMNVNTDASGIINPAQNRILWYPLKNAFLTGKVRIGTPDSVGENSFSSGYISKARGKYSQALGFKAVANGDFSTAIGKYALANNINSFAFGENAQAKNIESYSFGRGAITEGIRSFAFGSNGVDSAGQITGIAYAKGNYSFAAGQGSQALGIGSFTYGLADTAKGDYSVALGYKTSAGEYGTSMGSNTSASGRFSTAMGGWTKASFDFTTAMGFGTRANEEYSTAMGYGSIASGVVSTALGSSIASGGYSTSMGNGAKASKYCSFAMGDRSIASGDYSFAFGNVSTASGLASTALGWLTNASGDYALAMGIETNALGKGSISMGDNATAGLDYCFAYGYYTIANGLSSIAMGEFSEANSDYSVALGQYAYANGINSISLGNNTHASGIYSFASGHFSSSSGNTSVAMGFSEASGDYSTAIGYGSVSTGLKSTAIGSGVYATGDYSTAIGNEGVNALGAYSRIFGTNLVAYSGYETVLGRYNTEYLPASSTGWNTSDRLFVLGNGTALASRSNAITVLKNGSIGLQTVTNPTYALELPNSSTIGIGQAQAYAWATYSDGRAKSEQTVLSYGINEIMQLIPSEYFHHSTVTNENGIEINTEGVHDIGLIAQDVYNIIPEAVNKPENEEKELWSISYDKLVPVLINAVKEQQQLIGAQQRQIDQLSNSLIEMRQEITSLHPQ